jgi:hypothetical protein
MGFCPPRGDNSSFIVVCIGVNHRDFYAVHDPDRINADFAIIKTVVHAFKRWIFKNPLRILKGDSVPFDVEAVLVFVPVIYREADLHNVNTRFKSFAPRPVMPSTKSR